MAQSQSGTNVARLPDHMKQEARAYVDRGRSPGGFLRAVLSNDLMMAFSRADDANERHMKQWTMWLYNDIPSAAWGDAEAVEAWVEQGGKSGR